MNNVLYVPNVCEYIYNANRTKNIYAACFRHNSEKEMEENFNKYSNDFNKNIKIQYRGQNIIGKLIGLRKDRYYDIYDKIILFFTTEDYINL